METNETTSQKTVIPSNIVVPSVRTKSGRIIREPKRYWEEF